MYQAIAEHITEGRAPDIDADKFREWLASIDGRNDPTFTKLDHALDEFVRRFRDREEV